jgi:hypothetical protein
MRRLCRAQAVKLRIRRCQLAAQCYYYRAQLVVDLGQQLAFEYSVALFKFSALLREDLLARESGVAFGALAREDGVVYSALSASTSAHSPARNASNSAT